MTGAFYGFEKHKTVPDPDLEICGGPGHPDPYKRGRGGRSPKKICFGLLGLSLAKNKEGGTGPQPPPLDPPLQENLLVQ